MPKLLKSHRIRLYPDAKQQELLRKTFGCCRLIYNLALEQRSTFGRSGRRISFSSWSAELKACKSELVFLKEVPHHCLQQALKDLDVAYTRFFSGTSGYPRPRKKYDNDSCRFPDPKQLKIERNAVDLPKFGKIRAIIHRPIQGILRSITVSREGDQWYASVLVKVRVVPIQPRAMYEGGYDFNVAQPIVESDGTKHDLPRVSTREELRKRRLQQGMARQQKGSKRREKTKAALRRLEARFARRRRNAAHQVSHRLTRKYTHLAAEAINVKNITASAKGTVEIPGRNVAQKSGLNRSILDLAPGQIRRFIAYKAGWRGGVFVCVNPSYTSQTCSDCGRHPKDDVSTLHLSHGRINRDLFVCPLYGYTADADWNAARNIRARGRLYWTTEHAMPNAAGPAVSACRDLCNKHVDETGKKIFLPSILPSDGNKRSLVL